MARLSASAAGAAVASRLVASRALITVAGVVVIAHLLLASVSSATAASTDSHDASMLAAEDAEFRISLTISARRRLVEISWTGMPATETGVILLTAAPLPLNAEFQRLPGPPLPDPKYYANRDQEAFLPPTPNPAPVWRTPLGVPIRYALPLDGGQANGWQTTDVPFNVSAVPLLLSTTCYGFWATFLPVAGSRLPRQQTCLRAYPRWMNDLRPQIESRRMRDLFLLGSHDSGSYRAGFEPRDNETRVSKYSLTQDDDIRTQLMLGVRYLDIRVGSYRCRSGCANRADSAGDSQAQAGRQFWVNHGISRMQPLEVVVQQVRDFVLASGELVIFDVQEFPVGFQKEARHRALVYYLQQALGDVLVSPRLTWNATLGEMWRTGGRVLVSYDVEWVVEEFGGEVVFQSVQQRWGNVQTVADLRRYLEAQGKAFQLHTPRPLADMAEMTPTAWDVLTDKYGGLRRMADETNRQVSHWYSREWGCSANIVAVDFVRGSTIMETSLRLNQQCPGKMTRTTN